MRIDHPKSGPFEGVESPISANGPLHTGIEFAGAQGMRVDHKAALCRILCRGQIHSCSGFALQVQHKIVCDVGRKHDGSALHRKHQRRFLQAENAVFVQGTKRRRLRGFDGRQPHHDHGHGLSKRWRIIQPQVYLRTLRYRQRRDVLVRGRVEAAQQFCDIDHCPDIGAVKSCTHERHRGDLTHQVRGRT